MAKKTNESKEKTIEVIDFAKRKLSNCTKKKADRLVKSGFAHFISASLIQIHHNMELERTENKEIIRSSNRICYICNRTIPISEPATIDHVIPKSKGTELRYLYDNKQCCCEYCNNDKKNRTILEYVSYIEHHPKEYPQYKEADMLRLKRMAVRLTRKIMKKGQTT